MPDDRLSPVTVSPISMGSIKPSRKNAARSCRPDKSPFLYTALACCRAVLLLMVVPFVLPNGRPRQTLLLGGFLGTLVVFGLRYSTGEAGGRLVYEYGAAHVYADRDRGAILGEVVTGYDDDDDDEDSD